MKDVNSIPGNVVEKEAICLLRRKAVLDMTGLSRSGLYARIKEHTFPAPVKIGSKSVAWINTEVTHWISARIADRNASAQISI
jgi:prophage regulatory protein